MTIRNALDWLLEEENPGVRYLALRDLAGCAPDDPQLLVARAKAHREGPIAAVLDELEAGGYWVAPGPGYNPKYSATVWSLSLLAQLGARIEEDERIATACRYLMEQALAEGGQFSNTGAPSGTFDCLQGNLCWALPVLGCADPRLKLAFDWMARSNTGEGIAPQEDRSAKLRYYAAKCGPNFACGANNKLSCAWGATKVMLALGGIPVAERTPLIERAIQKGIEFLFSVDLMDANWASGYAEKPSSNWWKPGFPVFYVTDLLQVMEALAQLGYANDPRMAGALDWLRGKADAQGRWLLEYDYAGKTWVDFGPKKQPNKWVTLRALRVLQAAGIKA